MKTESKFRKTKIMLSGGGTGGSVTPLLAVAEELIKDDQNLELVFVGTKAGPEEKLIAAFSTRFQTIKFIPLISGKWRRYFSLHNFLDIFKIITAFFQAWLILGQETPALIVSAGSFVSVPLVWAAGLRRIPILIHQQDVRPGLANKLMAPLAQVISVTFSSSLADYGPKAVWVGNPVSQTAVDTAIRQVAATKDKYQLDPDRPILLVIGGGTGATAINDLVFKAQAELTVYCQVIHLTGAGKKQLAPPAAKNYKIFEFLDNQAVLNLMASVDLVISRAGLGVLTELAALNKPTLVIPLPKSHQEDNAALVNKLEAALVIDQAALTPAGLSAVIRETLASPAKRHKLGENIGRVIKKQASGNLAGIIWEMLKTKKQDVSK